MLTFACIYIYAIYIYVYIYIYMYIYIYACTIYIYIHICTYVYVYIYIFVYKHILQNIAYDILSAFDPGQLGHFLVGDWTNIRVLRRQGCGGTGTEKGVYRYTFGIIWSIVKQIGYQIVLDTISSVYEVLWSFVNRQKHPKFRDFFARMGTEPGGESRFSARLQQTSVELVRWTSMNQPWAACISTWCIFAVQRCPFPVDWWSTGAKPSTKACVWPVLASVSDPPSASAGNNRSIPLVNHHFPEWQYCQRIGTDPI